MLRTLLQANTDEGGVFVSSVTTFIVTDDLCVLPNTSGCIFQLLYDHGINDAGQCEERTFNIDREQDTTNSGGKKETKAIIFHIMETEEVSDRFVSPSFINGLEAYDGEINLGKEENMISNEFAVKLCLDHEFIINPEKDDVKPGVVLGRSFMRLTKGIADFRNEVITIYLELYPFLDSSGETEKIDDDWDLLLDDLNFGDIPKIKGVEIPPFVCKMGKNNKTRWREEEEAIIKVKGEALIEKEDHGAFVILIRLEAKINLNALPDTGSDINVMPYRVYKELGREELKNVNRGIRMLNHLKAEPMGLLKDVLCQKPEYTGNHSKKEEGDEKWHAEIRVTDPYGNVYDKDYGTHDNEAGSSRSKHFRQYETVEEAMLPRVHHPFLHWEGCNQVAKSRYNTRLTQLLPRLIYSPCVVDWNVLNYMGCGKVIDEMLTIKLSVAGIDEEIFTSEVCTRAFNIDEPIYNKLCHEFYSTYEFDEVCADDELRTKKIIKFKIYGHEINEEGFDVYFQGGLHSDEHFNAQEYWLSISQEENLSLSRSHDSTIHKPVLRVLHKMITYGLCQRTTGYDKMQKNDLWLLSMFEARHQNRYANVAWLIADEEERSW
ncbi:retrotransposon ORF1 [Tanacetum coccineum]